jgi:two-component system, cell cycle response regulator
MHERIESEVSEMTNVPTLDRVLSCPTLPTLPAVALQVLELTRDPNVTVASLARLVQSDPALSTKVLRTVNSSFFGLPSPCARIDRALALLGLNTIKSLVLGFTLVEGTKGVPGDKGLDLVRHWRRALYAASASRQVALTTKACDADEAFTASMLQDIGMMACIVAIPEAYGPVLAGCAKHERSPEVERSMLGFDHSEVGAALARKWRLPDHLAESIAHHHDPEKAPEAVRALCRNVWLGMLIAESLGIDSPANAQSRFLVEVARHLDSDPDELERMLIGIAEGADELARAFECEVGSPPDIREIMSAASEQSMELQMAAQHQAATLERENVALAAKAWTDALTGSRNRAALESEGPTAFDKSRAEKAPVAAIFIDADKFKSVNDTLGHPAGDAVLVELAARIRAELKEPARVYRYGGEEFAIVAPGHDRSAARALAERIRTRVEREPFDLSKVPGCPATRAVTVSAGYAVTTHGTGEPTDLKGLLKIADEGVYASKRDGRNRVSCAQEAAKPAEASGILLIEDDPFSARLVQTAVQKATGVAVTWVRHAEEAESHLSRGYKLVLCDFDLGKSTALDVLERARAARTAGATMPPIHILTSDTDETTKAKCLAAGAAAFRSKEEIAADLPGWCKQLVATLAKAA